MNIPARRFRDDWAMLMLLGGAFLSLSLVLFVGRLGRGIDAGVVAQCSTSYSHGYHALVVLEDRRRVYLGHDDLADPERCLPAGARIEQHRNALDFRLNGRPHRWPGRGFVPGLAELGALFILIGAGLRRLARGSSIAPARSGSLARAEPTPAREIWESTDPVRGWLPTYVPIALRSTPVVVACGIGLALVYASGGLSFVLAMGMAATGVAFANLNGPIVLRHAGARLERWLAARAARRRAERDPRVVRLRGRIKAGSRICGLIDPGAAVYRQLAVRGHGRFLPARLLLENACDFELLHAQGSTTIDVRSARWLCHGPPLSKLAPEPARELAALLAELHLRITVVAAGEALLRDGDEVEVIGFRSSTLPASGSNADSVLGSEGGVPLLVIPLG